MNENKEKGNDLFREQQFDEALDFYKAALDLAK